MTIEQTSIAKKCGIKFERDQLVAQGWANSDRSDFRLCCAR